MKYTKHIGAVLVGSLALIGGTSAYQLYPREGVVDPTANIIAEVEEEVVAKEEEPVGVGVTLTVEPQEVTNPAPLPATEPVAQVQTEPVSSEALNQAILPMIPKSNTTGGAYVTNQSIYAFIQKTYAANPAPFVPDNLQSIVDLCTNHLLEKYKELYSDPMGYIRYKSQNICPL